MRSSSSSSTRPISSASPSRPRGSRPRNRSQELRALGVDALQGFLLHRPGTVASFVERLPGLGRTGDPNGVTGPAEPLTAQAVVGAGSSTKMRISRSCTRVRYLA